MRKKYFYLIIIAAAAILLITVYNNEKHRIFTAEKINADMVLNKKTKDAISELCNDNGIFLFYPEQKNTAYLILDGTHVNLNGQIPYYSDVKIEAKGDTILISFNEEFKNYSNGKYPIQKLIYKITEDKNYKYIRVFKNGKETHISCIGG